MAILQNKFIREDGSVIGSSVIISCKYTSEVNSQTNLTVGDTTAAEVDVEIRNLAKEITAGEKLTYYQIEDGVENLIGVFYAEAPTIATKTSVRFKAYDGKAKLAVDFSEWLNNHQDDFPMSLRSLVQAACEVAGVTLASDGFRFEDLSIPAFYADGVTSRQIVSWAAQIAGCFVGCKTNGEIFFDWYRDGAIWISSKKTSYTSDYSLSILNGDLILNSGGEMPGYSIDENGHLILTYSGDEPPVYINDSGHLVMAEETSLKYALDGLSKSSYTTDPIKRVQFKQSTDDVGVIYPADADGNVFSISQNGIAALLDSDTLRSIAQYLYEKLKTVTYTPLTVKLPKRTANIKAGDIISVTDGNGNTVTTYVMKVYMDAGGTTITSTGDQNYADKAAVSSEKYKNIPGRVLEIEKSVDGLRIQNADTSGKLAELALDVDGVTAKVESIPGDGNNLLLGTKDFSGFRVNSWAGIFEKDDFGYVQFIDGARDDGEYKWVISDKKTVAMESVLDKEVTISFELRDDAPWTAVGNMIQLELAGCNDTSTRRLRYKIVNVGADIISEWKRVSKKFTITEDFFTGIGDDYTGYFSSVTRFWIRLYCNNDGQRLEVRKFKMELGGVATDWGLAGEEIDTAISTLKVTAKGVDMVSENGNGKLVSFIGNVDNGSGGTKGAWKAEYIKDGAVASALCFDFDEGNFVFDGKVIAKSGEIGGCSIVDGKLVVPTANLDGALTFGNGSYYIDPKAESNYLKLPGLAITSGGAEFDGKVIAKSGEIGGCSIVDGKLVVPTANLDGALTFGNGSYYIDPKAESNYLKLPGLAITSGGAEFDGKVIAKSGEIGGWNIGPIEAINDDTAIYSGKALYSDTFTETIGTYTGYTVRIALTPQYLILFGTAKDGANVAVRKAWTSIIGS